MEKKYSYEEKKKLANKISKIKKKGDLVKIFQIIYGENQSVTENNNGFFMFFHKLSDPTYVKIDIFLKQLNKKRIEESSETLSSEKKEYRPYTEEDFPSQKGICPKLKFSNKEKNLIKRRIYDKNMNNQNDTDVFIL